MLRPKFRFTHDEVRIIVMALDEHEQNEDDVETPDELSPAGELAYNIADHLAEVTAERFSEMIDGLDMDIAKQIVRRLQASDAEALIGMLQEMFLIKGIPLTNESALRCILRAVF